MRNLGMPHEDFMRLALAQAAKAQAIDETPIGAVIVKDDQVLASGYNLRESRQDVTLHAEMIAIRKACEKLGSWRLDGCRLYVTLEPCSMCAGAIIQSRIDTLIYGADDPKAGAAGSLFDLFSLRHNHQVRIERGILKDDCQAVLRDFFRDLRRRDKAMGSRGKRRRQAKGRSID